MFYKNAIWHRAIAISNSSTKIVKFRKYQNSILLSIHYYYTVKILYIHQQNCTNIQHITNYLNYTWNNKIKFKSGLHLTMTQIYITFLVTWFIHQLVVSEAVRLLDCAAPRMAGLAQFRLFVVLQS